MSALPIEPALVPGVTYGMPEAQYHSTTAIGASSLKALATRSPAHYKAGGAEPTDAQVLGTAIHLATLEPDRFDREVLVLPADAPRRPTAAQAGAARPSPATIDAIAWWDDWERRAAGGIVLSAEDHDTARRAADAVRAHPAAAHVLAHGVAEVTLQWVDADSGAPCRARLDWLAADGGVLDLKSTVDASPAGFANAIARYSYHLQEVHYRAGCEAVLGQQPPYFAFCAVEKVEPFAVGVYVLDADSLTGAWARREDALRRWAECNRTGRWPAYSDLIETITLPKWAI